MSQQNMKSGSPAFTPTLTEGTVVTVFYMDVTQPLAVATVQRCDGLGLTLNYPTGYRTIFHPWHTLDQVVLGDVTKTAPKPKPQAPEQIIDLDFPNLTDEVMESEPWLDEEDDDTERLDRAVAEARKILSDPFGAALAQAMSAKGTHFYTDRTTRAIQHGTLVASSSSGFDFIPAGTKKVQHYSWSAATAMGVMKVGA